MPVRHNITGADQLFFGQSQIGAKFDSKRGIPIHPVTFVDLGAPAALDADALVVAATSTELPNATTITYTFPGSASPIDGARADGVLATPRNITAAATHGSSVVAMTLLVTGKDENNVALTESLSIAATGTSQTATGKKAFKTITSIAITSAGDATTNTLDMGFGDTLGLPYQLTHKNKAIYLMDGVVQTGGTVTAADTNTATATTGDVRGTILPGTATNGTRRYGVFMVDVPASERNNSANSAYGVAQNG
jgi:hypothetical protein